jgi:hypothetical protein
MPFASIAWMAFIDELVNAPVTYFDGANDKYDSAPAEIRHL